MPGRSTRRDVRAVAQGELITTTGDLAIEISTGVGG
jgi:hypothetical protein